MATYMYPVKKLIVELCKNITLNTEPLNVLTDFSPENEIPCLTMNEEPGLGLVNTYLTTEKKPGETDTYQRVRIDKYKKAIGTHAWSQESTEERDYIISELERVVREAKEGYYHYCVNYNHITGECTTTKKTCDAADKDGIVNTQTLEKRCPYPNITDSTSPDYRNPQTWFKQLGINTETFTPRADNVADELQITPVVYHKYIVWDYEEYVRTVVDTGTFTGTTQTDTIL